ncbi:MULTISPECIES: putative 2OG-Fe(II) oxygenase [unclassified Pseudomonas]|uniref:putative 2OG-Fe(II) oxygenase n=1 Tax=unclassified Pseudomonas TaxID=196821 RepID=UPI0023E382FB|nr:putative 2OG-Fe(II) oxygenase [Pseudomonas sp. D3]WET12958.1 putative 2OG-Fe(II) oxygenase [Pseudomonas sp. D3]
MKAMVEPEAIKITRLFTTPVASIIHPLAHSLNPQLLEIIRERMEKDPGSRHSNQGGWQSTGDFNEWGGIQGRELHDFASKAASELTAVHSQEFGLSEAQFPWTSNSWANVNLAGQSNSVHGHAGAFWSAVYWVDDGGRHEDPSIGGDLSFIDPRGLMPSVYNPSLRMKVEGCVSAGCNASFAATSGMLLLFPSWLMHSVELFSGHRPRVSIAFNFGL